MQTKNIAIIASVVVGIAIVGVAAATQYYVQDPLDIYAVDSETVGVLLDSKRNILLVDTRTAEQYQSGHMFGASHDILDSQTLEKRVKTIQSRLPEVASSHYVVLVDDDGSQAKQMAQTMTEMGIQTFYLDGGMNSVSENIVSGTQTVIDSQELTERLANNDDLYLLDVREPSELLESKIDGAVNIPLAEIFKPNGMDQIPTDKPVVVICGSGNRATIATYALAQEGIDFQVLEGGMIAWNSNL